MAHDDRARDLCVRRKLDFEAQAVCRERVRWMCEQTVGSRVLHVGCSQGVISLVLAREGRTVIGIDAEEPQIETARAALQQEPDDVQPRATFQVGDALNVDFERASFDTVIIGEVLGRLARPADLLARSATWLRPGGRVVVSVPHGCQEDDDRTRPFHPGSLLELLGEHFSLVELDVVADRFLCAVAVKPATGRAPRSPSREVVRRWEKRCYDALEQAQRRVQEEKLALREELSEREAEYRAALEECRQLRRRLEQASYHKAELDVLRQGVRYRLGDAFVTAARSPSGAVSLPYRLAKLLLEGWGRVRARQRESRQPKAKATSAVTGPAAKGQTNRLVSGRAATGEARSSAGAHFDRLATRLPPAYAPTLSDQIVRKELKVAGVMDEFSWRAWQYEAELIPFAPEDWRAVLEERKPDLLFVESAWRGVNDSWFFQLRDLGHRRDIVRRYALPDIIGWCRARDIPTVFYNKEDPPNFEVFIDAAKLFDYVFTSDANCISDYCERMGHARVFALPFAAQPQIHNPISTAERSGLVCFAGTWYARRHLGRREDAEKILEPALEFGLHIFDRMANSVEEDYRWPKIFQPAVRGALPYAEMIDAYKRYKVFVNVNSVADSPTMFSRRVFELLASGTPVVSAYSEGIANLLGEDVVLMSRAAAETRELLARALGDEEYRARLSLLGQRKVFAEHTYTHRLNAVLDMVGLEATPIGGPGLTMIAPVETGEQLAAAWENYRRQAYQCKRLVVCTDRPAAVAAVDRITNEAQDVSVVAAEGAPWGHVLRAALDKADGEYVLALNPNDYYGPHYLTDTAHATLYARDAALGKAALFQAENGGTPQVVEADREYHYVNQVCPWTLCLRTGVAARFAADLVAVQTPFEWWSRLMRVQNRLYATDRFGYVRQGDGQPAKWSRLVEDHHFAGSAAQTMEPALV